MVHSPQFSPTSRAHVSCLIFRPTMFTLTPNTVDPVQIDRYPIGDNVSPQILNDDNSDGLDTILVVDDDIRGQLHKGTIGFGL